MGKKEETIRNISGNILKTLFRHQKSSRTRISKSLKITPATITNMISYLVAEKKLLRLAMRFEIILDQVVVDDLLQ
ncbi:transcriptional regulator/sugar kinase [Streptococcus suis]|uniref:hypothetical protein n=1 Tax=Streptococcus suis TaxID=1307 RepID=UPI0007693B3F|nr:hypothetical protein [Streptococcus suis]MDG3269446.1 hypothetical protein [Streptococcus suis]MDN3013356.1 hypothetical protein [Streptococcus suis]CYT85732.1 transcriptional regulator/sugar kinase [Streptococcus suis]CYU58585.1 transcriptional regulator/sugar kinase [Streptococcus suis]CYU83053.1 transcriptional regulator/sugar kinase [Streptococcus suis]